MLTNLPAPIKKISILLNKKSVKYFVGIGILFFGVLIVGTDIFLTEKPINQPVTTIKAELKEDFTKHNNDAETIKPINDNKIYIATVGKNESLSTIFSKFNLSQADLHRAINSDKQAKNFFTNLKPEQQITIETDFNNQLIRIFSELSQLESIELTKVEQNFSFNHKIETPYIEEHYANSFIKNSLFLDAQSVGLSDNLILKLADIFAYDIDFTQDLRSGDEFELIYENKYHNEQKIGIGNILAARFTVRGTTYTAFLYKNAKGEMQYFNAEGKGLRKQFLRTPIEYARISSRFLSARKHPVLNTIRAHKGVDYAAKTGTPIKVTADGKVTFSGWRGGYGNAVIVQHGNKYSTLYGHLSRFNKSAKVGNRVKQGQIIGYVGETGLARGPHVHYEFRVNGVHIDPLSRKLPAVDPAPVANKQEFIKDIVALIERMDKEKSRNLALLKSSSNISVQ